MNGGWRDSLVCGDNGYRLPIGCSATPELQFIDRLLGQFYM